ncbi:uncharacterized protein LACBIDRAFT_321568 [Laccaria bicolor S238N-H82]|uniref:Predicted protein n=1 Tax=Laccaria bicolor (strain S238N-H82 / ATCC MYA-4686) TaxID=486041 RepID=B0CTD3_LACBS|nr:uncharacterized protein LACBIDRAFT_321568 [Laccaria bicolor S238N-H82]EDR14475.1 predicted protein [Laccaria bicolor S238N-H82]|eukprot:XP_001875034.1 predicted protein [Laccaria bicolor S238N-H82]
MTDITDREVQATTSSSAMTDIENALKSLKLSPADTQQVVRAFLAILNATPSSSPSMLPCSSLSATDNAASSHSAGNEDFKDSEDEEQGDAPSLPPLQCATCAFSMAGAQPPVADAGSAPSSVIASTTAVAETRAPTPASSLVAVPTVVVPISPAAASLPSAAASITAMTAPIVANGAATTTTTTTASVGAAVGPAVPLYSQLPPNVPSNAVLPPPHLVTVGHGYHVPGPNDNPPFYVVTRGCNIGIFSGWENVSPLVTGVSHAVFSRVGSIAEGHNRMTMARTSAFAVYLA